MTKETFQKLETICRDEWQRLAETGDTYKRCLADFLNHCPACHISSLAAELPRQSCVLCPIDKWRELARKYDLPPRTAACECIRVHPDTDDDTDGIDIVSEFARWDLSDNNADRKQYAKVIASMPWSYLPEYANIEEGDLPI